MFVPRYQGLAVSHGLTRVIRRPACRFCITAVNGDSCVLTTRRPRVAAAWQRWDSADHVREFGFASLVSEQRAAMARAQVRSIPARPRWSFTEQRTQQRLRSHARSISRAVRAPRA